MSSQVSPSPPKLVLIYFLTLATLMWGFLVTAVTVFLGFFFAELLLIHLVALGMSEYAAHGLSITV